MKKLYFILFSMLLQIKCFAVTVEITVNLNVYYPEYSRINLVCGQMPKAALFVIINSRVDRYLSHGSRHTQVPVPVTNICINQIIVRFFYKILQM